jgi:lipoprotein signal peptidase
VTGPAGSSNPAGSSTPAASPASAPGFAGKGWFWWPWPPLVALDLWSKHVVFAFLETQYARVPEPMRRHLVFDSGMFDSGSGASTDGSALRLDFVSWGNPGTIWGLFPDGTIPLMVLRCFAVLGLFWFVRRTEKEARLQQLVLGLILAGALGNLYDNFMRADRTVRDFLYFSGQWPWQWDFPAFNVADSCITVGAIGLFLLLWQEDRAQARAKVS